MNIRLFCLCRCFIYILLYLIFFSLIHYICMVVSLYLCTSFLVVWCVAFLLCVQDVLLSTVARTHNWFLGSFAKLRKATISFVTSVCPHGPTRLPLEGFSWNLIFEYVSKKIPVEKTQISLKSEKKTGTFVFNYCLLCCSMVFMLFCCYYVVLLLCCSVIICVVLCIDCVYCTIATGC